MAGAILFFLVALGIAVDACRLGIGTLRSPQAGFFPFVAGASLGILSIACFLLEIRKRSILQGRERDALLGRSSLLKLAGVIASLILYAFLLELLGFILCTVLIVVFWLKIVTGQRTVTAVIAAILIPLASYFLFYVWLGVPLPKGFLTF